jgi:hypothetical protein
VLFTPDERRALIAMAGLVLLGLAARWVLPHPPAPLTGGDSLLTVLAVPGSGTPPVGKSPQEPPPGLAADGRLRINAAREEDLVALPGVGPALARRILEARTRGGPFRGPEDLDRVRGIGPALLARLAPHLSFDPGVPPALPASADCTAVSQAARPGPPAGGSIPRN